MLNKLSLEQATALLDASPLATLLLAADGSVHAWNAAFGDLLGETAAALSNELLAPLLGQATLISWVMPDGDERWLAVESVSLQDCTARFYQDVTEKLRLRQERDACSAELQNQELRERVAMLEQQVIKSMENYGVHIVAALEKHLIALALETHDGNRSRASEELEISYRALLQKIKEYGV